MTTLAEFMIIAGADNHPPMLEKSLYDSWKSRMEFYMENMVNGRIILDSVLNGLLVWPTITQEDGTTRRKTYAEFSATEKLQADWDCKATNIVLQGLPPDVYAIGETLYQYYCRFAQLINTMNVINMSMRQVQVNTKFLNSLLTEWSKFVTDVKLARDLHTTNYDQFHSSVPPSQQYQSHMDHQTSSVSQIAYHSPQALTQPMIEFPKIDSNLAVLVFSQGIDPIAYLNKAMAFLTAIASSRVMLLVLEETIQADMQGLLNAIIVKTEDLDAYDSDCDDVSNAKVVLMVNLYNYGSDVILEVPRSKTYHNDMDNQSVHAMQDFEQTSVIDFSNNKIHSDSNIILYSQYLQETQQAVQDTNLYAE
ncbi:hypothetical protein Tco_0484311 [Tanacetum coccineum]